MPDSEFSVKSLITTNKLIDKFGQFIAVLKKDKDVKDSDKPWLGEKDSYSSTFVKSISKVIEDNVLSTSNSRMQNDMTEFLISGDSLTEINSQDLIFTFKGLVESKLDLSVYSESTNFDVSLSGVYIVDATSGNIDVTLNASNPDGTVIFIAREYSNTNAVTITPQVGATVGGLPDYAMNMSSDVICLLLSGGDYIFCSRYKIYDSVAVSPSGTNILYKIRVGA